jgi:hypothetical protein
MLFILVFDVLNVVFKLAEEVGIFTSFESCGILHPLSLLADDVVLMMRPTAVAVPGV